LKPVVVPVKKVIDPAQLFKKDSPPSSPKQETKPVPGKLVNPFKKDLEPVKPPPLMPKPRQLL
jgi:hypothetical protein